MLCCRQFSEEDENLLSWKPHPLAKRFLGGIWIQQVLHNLQTVTRLPCMGVDAGEWWW